MNTNSISEYLNNRLVKSSQIYHEKNLTNNINSHQQNNDDLFNIVFFCVMRKITDGHTVFSLDLNNNLEKQFLDVIAPFIHTYLNKEFDLKKHLYQKDFPQELSVNFKSTINNSNVKNNIINQIVKLVNNLNGLTTKLNESTPSSCFLELINNHNLFAEYPNANTEFAPLMYVLDDNQCHIWLGRSFLAERELLESINNIINTSINPIPISNIANVNKEQADAINKVANGSFTIITGGPGTGKTYTVAKLVQCLLAYEEDAINGGVLALTAPTGKAAQRMAESLQAALPAGTFLPEPKTVHRLLGIGRNDAPRYNKSNPMPYDMIIVDEASMLGTELARDLFSAVKTGARLILLGDAHQLSAVDAGSVLADLCRLPHLTNNRVHLIESNRFDDKSAVGKLAKLINNSSHIDNDEVKKIVDNSNELEFYNIANHEFKNNETLYKKLMEVYINSEGYISQTLKYKDSFYLKNDVEKKQILSDLISSFNKYRILCASHLGVCGDHTINDYIEIKHKIKIGKKYFQTQWYHGRPVMVLENRYDLGLFNGDIGICLQNGKHENNLSVYFLTDKVISYPTSFLDGEVVNSAYAMTIHKSQGSEFDTVAVLLHDENKRLLSKELIYTAITRAKRCVHLYATPDALNTAINNPTIRNTGLDIQVNIN